MFSASLLIPTQPVIIEAGKGDAQTNNNRHCLQYSQRNELLEYSQRNELPMGGDILSRWIWVKTLCMVTISRAINVGVLGRQCNLVVDLCYLWCVCRLVIHVMGDRVIQI